jgi:hypothetical protein
MAAGIGDFQHIVLRQFLADLDADILALSGIVEPSGAALVDGERRIDQVALVIRRR